MSDIIIKMLSDYFGSLSHPTRLEILYLLKNEMCVCEIVEKLKKDQSNISRHLNILRRNGVVEFRSNGVKSMYKTKYKQVYELLELVRSILHKQARERQEILKAI